MTGTGPTAPKRHSGLDPESSAPRAHRRAFVPHKALDARLRGGNAADGGESQAKAVVTTGLGGMEARLHRQLWMVAASIVGLTVALVKLVL